LAEDIYEKGLYPTSKKEIEPRLRNVGKQVLDHFFGMKPKLSKVIKERFC